MAKMTFAQALKYAEDQFEELGMPRAWARGFMFAENDADPAAFNPIRESHKGAFGPMQVKEIAQAEVNRLGKLKSSALNKIMSPQDFRLNRKNPYQNIRLGALYVKGIQDRDRINDPKALASEYFSGNSERYLSKTDAKNYVDTFSKYAELNGGTGDDTVEKELTPEEAAAGRIMQQFGRAEPETKTFEKAPITEALSYPNIVKALRDFSQRFQLGPRQLSGGEVATESMRRALAARRSQPQGRFASPPPDQRYSPVPPRVPQPGDFEDLIAREIGPPPGGFNAPQEVPPPAYHIPTEDEQPNIEGLPWLLDREAMRPISQTGAHQPSIASTMRREGYSSEEQGGGLPFRAIYDYLFGGR